MMSNQTGDARIVIPGGANVWPHELKTARALASAGHKIEFILKSNREREASADALVDDVRWEFKAPNGGKMSLVEKNLRRGARQCGNLVFDSHRIKNLPDRAIERELRKWSVEIKGIDKLLFINRHREIIVIR